MILLNEIASIITLRLQDGSSRGVRLYRPTESPLYREIKCKGVSDNPLLKKEHGTFSQRLPLATAIINYSKTLISPPPVHNIMKARLPHFFSIKQSTDLVRIGRDYDGGYLVSKSDIEQTDLLLGFGISDDWSFEEDFLNQKKVSIEAYDASVSERIFFRRLLGSTLRIYRFKRFLNSLNVLLKYRKFFSQPNVNHLQKFVGLDIKTQPNVNHLQKFVGMNIKSEQYCSFMDVLNQTESKNIFLKIDIEGSEYRMLHDIVANEERITGLVLEFHDVDIHLNKIEKFINELSLNLVHVHANNFRPLREDDDLPLVLEVTFSKHSNVSTDYNLPHKLDMPNNKNGMEYELLINDK